MYVTRSMLYRQTQLGLERINAGYAQASAQATSGKRINQASDDASGSIISQYTHRTLEQVSQYTSNVGMVKDWLSQSASSMQSMTDLLQQAQSAASQLATGTYTEEQRTTLAGSIQNIMDELITQGNTQVNGRYIYGGTRTSDQPVTGAMLAETPATRVGLASDLVYYKSQASVANPAATLVSSKVGEAFGFTGQGSPQTYETAQTLTLTAGVLALGDSDSVVINGNTYTSTQGGAILTAADAARDLAEQINSDPAGNTNYFAVVDTSGGNPTLKVYTDRGSSYSLTANGNNLVGSPVTAGFTMNNVVNAINGAGSAAQGILMLGANAAGSVTINGTTVNWAAAGSTAATLTNIAASINGDATLGSLVSARVDGNQVVITAANNGSQYDYAISGTGASTIIPTSQMHGGLAGAASTGVQASTVVNADGTSSLVLQRAGGGQTITLASAQTLGASQGLDFNAISQSGDGRLYGQGTYTGLYSRDITLTVQAGFAGGTPSAANPMNVDYSYVDDFGRTISGTTTLTGTGSGNGVDLGDGVQYYADAQTFAGGEVFTLQVGRQHGNAEDLSANLSQDNRMSFNHTLEELFGAEGNVGGDWGNLLDKLAGWKDSLVKDSKTQTYFEAVSGTTNSLASTADLRVSGNWDDLQNRSYKFVTGGPIQSNATAASRAAYRNFTVDPAYAGGVPSVANPMTVDYEYWDSGTSTWTATTDVITGTGSGNSITLHTLGAVPPNPPAASINVVNAAYAAGQALPLAGSATAGAPPYIATSATPTAGQPVMVTYTYLDANRVPQWGTTTFTGSGDGVADVLPLNPPGGDTLRLNAGGTLKDGDTWDLTLQQYNQGQTKSQEMLTSLATARTDLLRYTGDAGAKLNRLEVRDNLLGDDKVQLTGRLSTVESADISQVSIDLQKYQTMYQATLQALAMVSSRTLADYL